MTAKHILLVDDEEAIAYVFKRYLERAGYRVTTAITPGEAVDIAGLSDIDMLVTDFRMPGMNGASLVARLRERRPGLPAVIVTAYGAEVGMAPEHVRVLSKPLPPQQLLEAVALALGQVEPC